MNNNGLTTFLLICLLIPINMHGQSSFQKTFVQTPILGTGEFGTFETIISNAEQITLVCGITSEEGLFFIEEFDPNLNSQETINFNTPVFFLKSSNTSILGTTFSIKKDKFLLGRVTSSTFASDFSYPGAVLFWNLETNENWVRGANYFSFNLYNKFTSLSMDEQDNVYTFQMLDFFTLSKLSSEGDFLLEKSYDFPSFTDVEAFPLEAIFLEENSSQLVLGQLNEQHTFFIEFDSTGVVLSSQLLENIQLEKIIRKENGNFLAVGRTTLLSNLSDNESDLILLEISSELDIIWSRHFFADNFNYSKSEFNLLPDGSIMLAYSTEGAFPVILVKLSAMGEILWEKGYPLYEPKIDVFSDGSLLMTTLWHFDELGDKFLQTIVTKTDPLGNIDGCEEFLTCLMETPADVAFTALAVEEVLPPPLETAITHLIFQDTTLSTTDFCDIPPSPAPDFDLPDTICLQQTVFAENLKNHNAHGTEWNLLGTNIDQTWENQSNFFYTFNEAGEYWVTQTIWFLGCDYSHTEKVTVLSPLEITITTDGDFCQDETIQLFVNANRPLATYNWFDGGLNNMVSVDTNGSYFVEASDGFCTATDTISVVFPSEELNAETALQLPNDTTICVQHLPYILRPQSNFPILFFDSNGQIDSVFQLSDSGNYTYFVEIADCLFAKTFRLAVDECPVQVYLPNVFSPNNDGFNDVVLPMGTNFIPLEMRVFDRWGSQVFNTNQFNAGWQGRTSSGENLPVGVYVCQVVFQDLISQEQNEIFGDILLIR